jgi:hypothetical protein
MPKGDGGHMIESFFFSARTSQQRCPQKLVSGSRFAFSLDYFSILFRSCTVEPKKGLTVDPPAAIRITNIALGDVLADSSARTTLKLTYK